MPKVWPLLLNIAMSQDGKPAIHSSAHPCVGLWLVLFAPMKTKALDTNAAAGFELAKKYCARCHVIGEFNRLGGIGNTPSFPYMVKNADWQERFSSFSAADRIPCL